MSHRVRSIVNVPRYHQSLNPLLPYYVSIMPTSLRGTFGDRVQVATLLPLQKSPLPDIKKKNPLIPWEQPVQKHQNKLFTKTKKTSGNKIQNYTGNFTLVKFN